MLELELWESFYVIIGGAAGALIGLQFVVITLIAEHPPVRSPEAGAAFATPNVIHFGAALFIAALMRAPWEHVAPVATLWGLAGLAGIIYAILTVRRMQTQKAYKPEFEDWMFYGLLPLLTYAVLALSALWASYHTRNALFAVGAVAVMLLVIGIHNAWDSVTYHVFVNLPKQEKKPNT